MQIELHRLTGAIEALRTLVQQPLKGSVAFRLGKVIRDVQTHLDDLEQTRSQLLQKYGSTYDENGNPDLPPESIEAFTEEMEAVLSEQVTIPDYRIPLSVIEEIQITPSLMMQIDWLIDEDQ